MKALRLHSLALKDIKIRDKFWNSYTGLVAAAIIPYQWEILNNRIEGLEEGSCLKNFKIAAGTEKGDFNGAVFQDTDAYKWLEAVAFSLETRRDERLEEMADEAIALIEGAQQGDGYLNTYYTITAPDKRWSNLVEGHELYSAGHLIEAAVAYYRATGKESLLNVARRFADLICTVFGRGEGQIRGYAGHQEIELALIKLYYATGEKKYLDTAKYFIDERGSSPNYFEKEIKARQGHELHPDFRDYNPLYAQAHIPPRQQLTAEGHAVRAVYMYCAMAELAYEYGDAELLNTCDALWENLTTKRMYITGSIGSSGYLERFTADYDLPNDINYSETCAAIGLALFGLRMTSIKHDARYMDTVERALYNTLLSGISLEGDRYFYVNPLEVWPASCLPYTSKAHVKPVRQSWFNVACCPTNIARTLASLGQYIYMQHDAALYVNLYIENQAEVALKSGSVDLSLQTSFLIDGKSTLTFELKEADAFSLRLRVPGYVKKHAFTVNGKAVTPAIQDGYACIDGPWESRNTIEIDFDIRPEFIASNPEVRANSGKLALVKGPLVYCLEEVDNGANLAAVFVDVDTAIKECRDPALPGALPALVYEGYRLSSKGWEDNTLYGGAHFKLEPACLRAVPYGLWGNRGPGEMIVWQRALIR